MSSRLVKNSLIYSIIQILQKAMGFFLLPVYTRFLCAEDLGKANIVLSVVSFLGIFCSLGLSSAGTRYTYEARGEADGARTLWGTIFWFSLPYSLASTVVLFLFIKPLGALLAPGVSVYPLLALGLVSVALNPSFVLFQSKLQAEQRGMAFGITNFFFFLVNAATTVVLLTVFRLTAESLILAYAITNAIFFVYTLVAFPREIKIGIDGPTLRKVFLYSLPLLPHMLAGWTIGMIDKLFLNSMAGAGAVGVYTVGFQVANVLGTLTLAVNQAFGPWFFEQATKGEDGFRRSRVVTRLIIWFYGGCSLFAGLFGPEILRIMTPEAYHGGWTVIPLLLAGFSFNGIYYCAVGPLFLNKTTLIPIITFVSAGVGLVGNLTLIPRLGMEGAALASLAANLTGAVLASALSAAATKRSLGGVGLYSITTAMLLLSLIVYLPFAREGALGLFLRIAIFLAAAVFAFFLNRKDLPELFGALRKRA